MTHEMQMLIAQATAKQLAELADWMADRADLIGCAEANDLLLEARDWLNEAEPCGTGEEAEFRAQDYRDRLRNVRGAM